MMVKNFDSQLFPIILKQQQKEKDRIKDKKEKKKREKKFNLYYRGKSQRED